MVYYIKSQRGSNKLVDDNNYVYNFHRQTANKTRKVWLCEVKVCRARVQTNDSLEIVCSSGEHSHSADVTKLKARSAMSAIKDRALSSHEAARSVIATECSNLQDAVLAGLPATSSVSRNVRRWRQRKDCALPIPSARFGFHIPLEYCKFDSGDNFLQYDSGIEDEERILIFASSTGLEDLVK